MVARLAKRAAKAAARQAAQRTAQEKQAHVAALRLIDYIRRLLGYSQYDWAEKSGIDEALLARYLHGKHVPTLPTLKRLRLIVPKAIDPVLADPTRQAMLAELAAAAAMAHHLLLAGRLALGYVDSLRHRLPEDHPDVVAATGRANALFADFVAMARFLSDGLAKLGLAAGDFPFVDTLVWQATEVQSLRMNLYAPESMAVARRLLPQDLAKTIEAISGQRAQERVSATVDEITNIPAEAN